MVRVDCRMFHQHTRDQTHHVKASTSVGDTTLTPLCANVSVGRRFDTLQVTGRCVPFSPVTDFR